MSQLNIISLFLNGSQLYPHRSNIHENVEMIRLQREVKEKSTKLSALQAQYANLEEVSLLLTLNHPKPLKLQQLGFFDGLSSTA